jgi:hypothetical protein
MNRWVPVFSVAACLAYAAVASGTTVIPPSFDDLVAQADTIFVGRAVDSRSELEYSSTGRSIVTHVTFNVERVIKGRLGPVTQLTFLGGTVGDLKMDVADMPEFKIGDRDLLFVSSLVRAASPLVGFAYGRLRLVRDPVSGADQVRTHDGRPIGSVEDIGKAPSGSLQAPRAMALSEFDTKLRQKIDAQQRQR